MGGQRCCLLEELEAEALGPKEQGGKAAPTFDFPILTDFYRFFGLSWETSSQK